MTDRLKHFASYLLALILALALLPLLIVFLIPMTILGRVEKRRFLRSYRQFLCDHEGLELFCYTNRAHSEQIIERALIPQLPPELAVVKLIGKTPESDLPQAMVSHMLYELEHRGLPCVMRIHRGEVADLSLHRAIYNAINQHKTELLEGIVSDGLLSLRSTSVRQAVQEFT